MKKKSAFKENKVHKKLLSLKNKTVTIVLNEQQKSDDLSGEDIRLERSESCF